MNASTMSAAVILLNRLAVGWYFIVAGWGKLGMELTDGLGSFYQSESFQGRNPDWLPALVAAPYGYALPWAELILGALLLLGLLSRVTAGALAVITLSIATALFHAGQLLPNHHVMVFVPVLLWLAVAGPGRYSIDAWRSSRVDTTEQHGGVLQT